MSKTFLYGLLNRFNILNRKENNLMKQIKLLGVFALAFTLGLGACNNGNNNQGGESQGQQASVEECKKHTWGDWQIVTPKTCETDDKIFISYLSIIL